MRYQKHIGERLSLGIHGYGDHYTYEERLYNTDASGCPAADAAPCTVVPRGKSRWLGTELQTSVDWLRNDALTTLVGASVRVRNIEERIDIVAASDGRNFPVTPKAPFAITLRGTVSGEVPRVAGLGYRLSVNYVTADHSPYVAGPVQVEDPTVADRPAAALAPVNRLTTFLTLTYTLPL